jgi:hypothetical protein
LFPERDDRLGRQRWLLPAALLLSLLVHVAGGGAARWWWPRLAPAIAKLIPRPTPAPEIVALSDAITIEKRTVPREAHRTPPRRRPAPPRRRQIAQVPVLKIPPVPTLPPVSTPLPVRRPTPEATTAPTYRPVTGTLHHPVAPTPPPPRPRETAAPEAAKNGFSAQQMAALNAQFSRTIAQAQRSVSNVPPPRRPPARMPDQLRYQEVMSGTPEQFFAAFQGDCVPLEGPMMRGAVRFYYIRCMIRYNDGYFENVSYPWVYRFPARMDPFDERVNPNYDMRFAPQGPPAGFALPPHFALSRAICTFYRAQCEDIFTRERANGNQPATDRQ